jgi:hypothetical protein
VLVVSVSFSLQRTRGLARMASMYEDPPPPDER